MNNRDVQKHGCNYSYGMYAEFLHIDCSGRTHVVCSKFKHPFITCCEPVLPDFTKLPELNGTREKIRDEFLVSIACNFLLQFRTFGEVTRLSGGRPGSCCLNKPMHIFNLVQDNHDSNKSTIVTNPCRERH